MNLGRITGMDGLYFGVSRALPLIAALERSAICLTIAAAMRSASASLRRRSEEHTSELQSLMRISYAVFCLKKKKKVTTHKYVVNVNNELPVQQQRLT